MSFPKFLFLLIPVTLSAQEESTCCIAKLWNGIPKPIQKAIEYGTLATGLYIFGRKVYTYFQQGSDNPIPPHTAVQEFQPWTYECPFLYFDLTSDETEEQKAFDNLNLYNNWDVELFNAIKRTLALNKEADPWILNWPVFEESFNQVQQKLDHAAEHTAKLTSSIIQATLKNDLEEVSKLIALSPEDVVKPDTVKGINLGFLIAAQNGFKVLAENLMKYKYSPDAEHYVNVISWNIKELALLLAVNKNQRPIIDLLRPELLEQLTTDQLDIAGLCLFSAVLSEDIERIESFGNLFYKIYDSQTLHDSGVLSDTIQVLQQEAQRDNTNLSLQTDAVKIIQILLNASCVPHYMLPVSVPNSGHELCRLICNAVLAQIREPISSVIEEEGSVPACGYSDGHKASITLICNSGQDRNQNEQEVYQKTLNAISEIINNPTSIIELPQIFMLALVVIVAQLDEQISESILPILLQWPGFTKEMLSQLLKESLTDQIVRVVHSIKRYCHTGLLYNSRYQLQVNTDQSLSQSVSTKIADMISAKIAAMQNSEKTDE